MTNSANLILNAEAYLFNLGVSQNHINEILEASFVIPHSALYKVMPNVGRTVLSVSEPETATIRARDVMYNYPGSNAELLIQAVSRLSALRASEAIELANKAEAERQERHRITQLSTNLEEKASEESVTVAEHAAREIRERDLEIADLKSRLGMIG